VKRFIWVVGLLAVLGVVLVPAASAGGYTDASYATPTGQVGGFYSHTVAWKPYDGCPPFKYVFSSGQLPPGLSLSSDGHITGYPTTEGVYTFYIEMRDQCGVEGQGNAPFVIRISGHALKVVKPTAPDAFKGAAYSLTLNTTGGTGVGIAWSLLDGLLPPGLALNGSMISGTPTTNGVYQFDLKVVDNGGDTDTQNVHITVVDPLTASITTRIGEAGRPFSSTLQATGGASKYTYSVSGLPAGLAFDNAQTIAGTPTTGTKANVAVTVTDADGNHVTVNVPVVIHAKLAVASQRLVGAAKGHAYGARLRVAGGVRPLRWAARGLPRGLSLNAATGQLSGHPRTAGTFRVRVTVRDSVGATASRALLLTVH
jgi:hypothetical protein